MSVVIGSVPYLNARPLVDWFHATPEGRASGITVVEAVPSRLSGMLESGEVACALLSSVTLFQHPSWTYAPGAAIGSNGPVESVRLFTRGPVESIRRVALDTSSLTSVMLVRILLKEEFGITPEFLPHPPRLGAMLDTADAALVIGDNAFPEHTVAPVSYDLGEIWTRRTGLPFVYALWLGPSESLTPELSALLRTAKEWGTAHVAEVAERNAARHNRTVERAHRYMTEYIRYDLGPCEEEGLLLFGRKLREHELVGTK
ncbi:MAG: menaquinone biosynthesis protein [Capsulimonadales bacterium]|nr:menaquinone biosynthesis protein [Capsulimonadales bacterium]